MNAHTAGFFAATRETIDQAFMRPRVAGHRRFQPLAGELLHRCIWSDGYQRARMPGWIRALAESLLADWLRE